MYKSIALVDLSCLFKRTFEASPNKGAETTLNELLRIRDRVEHMVLCLDAPPYSRKALFADYKANRSAPETTEVYQKRWLFEQCEERGLTMAKLKGAEGDDVVATLARIYGEQCPEVWIVGADKDLAQCVTENVLQLVPPLGDRAEMFRAPKQVKEKYEVWPAEIPLWLALVGDKGDNVPGVPGIGPVKAAGLIGEFKTLQGIAEHLGSIGGKMGQALAQNWEQLVLSVKLTTLDSHLPLDAQALLVRREPKVAETMAPKVELEFDGFMGNATPMPEAPSIAVQIAAENAKLNVLMNAEPPKPEPLIGKDPRADEFLRQEAAARDQARNADRAAQEQHELEQKREEQWRQERRQAESAAFVLTSAHREHYWSRLVYRAPELWTPLERQIVEAMKDEPDPRAPKSAPAPKVTEAEFDPIGKSPGASGPLPPKAAPAPAERADRPGLAKTTPEYGMVTSKLEPEDLRSAEVIAKWLDAGGLYKQKFKSPAAIVTVIMYGKALGLPMMAALSGFHIIEGKPSASADLIRALAMRSPKCKYFRLVSADETQATWETWHRDHDEPSRLVYTIEEARKAGLRGGNWNSREKQMLVKTCSTILARWVYTIETMGLYCPEEMGDYVDTVGEAA